MSLHLGNLSSRVNRNELERVFWRFGRCNVQLKDGYGFVVYDFPTNAEKALRVLRGKKICGEPISLSWSNRQPRPLQRFSGGNRSYETQYGRNSGTRDDYPNQRLGFKVHRDHKFGFENQGTDGGKLNSEDMVDEVTRYEEDNLKENSGENLDKLKEDFPDEGNNVHRNIIDIDRWEERVDVQVNEIVVNGEQEFSRYDPYLNDKDNTDVDENLQERSSGRSPTLRKSQDKIGRGFGVGAINHLDDSKPRPSCYICGEPDHKMHSCPREKASRRKKLSRSDHGQNNDTKGNIKGFGSRSRERLYFSRDVQIMHPRIDRKVSRSMKHQRLMRSVNSRVTEETHNGARRKDHMEKKRSRRENGNPNKRRDKKVRGPVSSSINSDYTASRLLSQAESSRSVSGSATASKSKSLSSRTRSPSRSAVQYFGSGGNKPRARARSSSPMSLSLSVSLGRPLTSSPSKTRMNQDFFVDANCPDPTMILIEQAQLVEGNVGSDNLKLDNMYVQVENDSAVEPIKVEDKAQEDDSPKNDINNDCAMSKVFSDIKNSCNPPSEKVDMTAESMSLQILAGIDIQNPDVLVTGQTLITDKRTVSEAFMLDNLSAPTTMPDPGASLRSCSSNPMRISSEELCMALKHYGLNHPAEDEEHLPVEAYFGSARFWPWEIIYYRRLKKGPISKEYYA